jgi:hypothetical protein
MIRFQRQARLNAMGSPSITRKAMRMSLFVAAFAGAAHSHSARSADLSYVRLLKAELMAHDSASEVLGRWCASHHLAEPPVIRALQNPTVTKPADNRIRGLLRLTAGEPVRYRRVSLVCGAHVLSNADNWYVPDRLTPEMNRQLDSTNTPFGLVVKPLDYHRVRFAPAKPPPPDQSTTDEHEVLRNEALLIMAAGLPFSFVVETYTPEVLVVSPSHR